MSQHTEDQETLRRNARAELLVNLPAVEQEMSEAMLVPLSGSIETIKQFIAAVAEYLRGEEELERELEEEKAAQ